MTSPCLPWLGSSLGIEPAHCRCPQQDRGLNAGSLLGMWVCFLGVLWTPQPPESPDMDICPPQDILMWMTSPQMLMAAICLMVPATGPMCGGIPSWMDTNDGASPALFCGLY